MDLSGRMGHNTNFSYLTKDVRLAQSRKSKSSKVAWMSIELETSEHVFTTSASIIVSTENLGIFGSFYNLSRLDTCFKYLLDGDISNIASFFLFVME